MIRMFQTNETRKVKELEGLWDFQTLTPDEKPEKSYSLYVPGCWETHPELSSFRGRGVYTKTIEVEECANLRFVFYGVSHTGTVYFDGKEIAHHYNAFTGFDAVIPQAAPGSHELKILVDNRFSEASALHIPNDYYTYGGLTRPVAMENIPDVFLETVHVRPIRQADGWDAEISLTLRRVTDQSKEVHPVCTISGETLDFGTVTVGQERVVITKTCTVSDVTPWTQENPVLYLVKAGLQDANGNLIDDCIERIGFREVKVEGREILLNGKPVVIKGFNRHEDHPMYGCAIPVSLMVQDLDLMQDMNANAVRTCHYPNDSRFLDLCDERGILVWEENHARGLTEEQMKNPNFQRQCADCIDEMVREHYNHPSIIIWGIMNECASDTDYGRSCYESQFAQLRRLDSSRPLTFASCRHYNDICLDLVDIVSYNIYPLWYSEQSPTEFCQDLQKWIETTGGAGKPLIISEIGAGGIYGYRDMSHCKWTEERQAEIVGQDIDEIYAIKGVPGMFIWQYCDCRVTEERWFHGRPKSQNNKGVVDRYRRPKMAYQTVKEKFGKL